MKPLLVSLAHFVHLSLLFLFFSRLQPALAYKYPNPQVDEIDNYLYDLFGYHQSKTFDDAFGIHDCTSVGNGGSTLGRASAAEVCSESSPFSH
jgi:hypothetical protein